MGNYGFSFSYIINLYVTLFLFFCFWQKLREDFYDTSVENERMYVCIFCFIIITGVKSMPFGNEYFNIKMMRGWSFLIISYLIYFIKYYFLDYRTRQVEGNFCKLGIILRIFVVYVICWLVGCWYIEITPFRIEISIGASALNVSQ